MRVPLPTPDGPEITNKVRVRLEVYRYVIHALEVRAVDR